MTYISWTSDFACYLRPYLIDRRHTGHSSNGGLDKLSLDNHSSLFCCCCELTISYLFRPNGEWEVVKTDVTTSTITETRNGVTKSFSQLEFWIHLKRRDQFYNTNVMLPIILSSILVTLVFLVPVESGEKLSYILTVLLTIAVFLTIIGDTLPAISLTTSVLGSLSLSPRKCYENKKMLYTFLQNNMF